jgi:putative membrane protein insertion efficiency factor
MTTEIPSDNLPPEEPGHEGHAHGAGDYPSEPRLRDLPKRLDYLPRLLLLVPIRIYQATLSHALPANTCRFYPTCSHYGYQAIYKYGALRGGLMAAWRILRCNPFNPGGYDPVP